MDDRNISARDSRVWDFSLWEGSQSLPTHAGYFLRFSGWADRDRKFRLHLLTIPILLLSILPSFGLAREKVYSVSGQVVDSLTSRALSFANVSVDEGRYHASADAEGRFTVRTPADGARLLVSCVGYRTSVVEARPAGPPVVVKLTPVDYVAHDVEVVGTMIPRSEPNLLKLANSRMDDYTGITRDPMRELQFLPGVSSNDEGSAKVNVRGGTWDENEVLIDGAEIYDPYHLKEVSMASIGVFNQDMVKSIDFSPGGFGAEFGDALSSVTSVHYLEGNREHLEGAVNLSPLDFSTTIQGPISGKSSFIVAARGSYLGYMLKGLSVAPGMSAGYYDVQGDVAYHFNNTAKLKLDFLYSNDNAIESSSQLVNLSPYSELVLGKSTSVIRTIRASSTFDGRYSNSLVSASFDGAVGGDFYMHTLVYYTGNAGRERPTENTESLTSYSDLPDLVMKSDLIGNQSYDFNMSIVSLRQNAEYAPTDGLSIKGGVGVSSMACRYIPDMFSYIESETNVATYPDTAFSSQPSPLVYHDTTSVNAGTYSLSAYLEGNISAFENFLVTPGVRYDYFDLDKEERFSPRLNVSYLAPAGVRLNGSAGVYYQLPAYNQLRMGKPSSANTRFQKATHYVLGMSREFGELADVRLQLFQKYYSDLVPAVRTPYGGLFYETGENDGVGYSKGFDLQCAMNFGDFDLSLAYGYLVSMEKSGLEESYHPRFSDQRHTASFELTYEPGAGWNVEVRGLYGSGYAYSPYSQATDSIVALAAATGQAEDYAHFPPYERVDVRVTKSFTVMKSPLQLFADVTNVFNRKNVWGYRFSYDSKGDPISQPVTLLGIVPAIGVSYKFGL